MSFSFPMFVDVHIRARQALIKGLNGKYSRLCFVPTKRYKMVDQRTLFSPCK